MDFELSEEQRLLDNSIGRLLADRYDHAQRKRYMAEPDGFSRAMWRRYAELGLIGLCFPEADGGSGGGPVETMIVMEAFGRALTLEPYSGNAVVAPRLLQHAQPAIRALLPRIAAGETLVAFAHAETQARYDLADVALAARRQGDDFILDGEKSLVANGDSADHFIVSARLSGDRRDAAGIGLFCVSAGASGISRRGYPTVDGLRAAEVTFANVRVPAEAALGVPGEAHAPILQACDCLIAALCAEAVGAMAALHEMTVEYLKTRRQFGAPIGNLQVLQHRAADMLVALEQARSMAMYAAMTADEPDAAQRRRAISEAKVQIGRSGRFIGQQAIQLHGGIGMTMEYAAGQYFKRLTAIDTLFGTADHHLRLLAGMPPAA